MKRQRTSARIQDIARAADVSTATVDRVLNGRAGVSATTVARVKRAAADLNAGPAPRAATGVAVGLALPIGAGPSTDYLALAMGQAAQAAGIRLVVERPPKLDPSALASALNQLNAAGCRAIAFQALDHPFVRDAVAHIRACGVPLLTVMSDLQGSGAFGFIGADNRAAGRTAGALMGRFVHTRGRVAVLWGGTLYRSHEEREIGFRTLLREDVPHLRAEDIEGGDEQDGNFEAISDWLARTEDAVGIYSVGGGNRGVARALARYARAAAAPRHIAVIAHNLTPVTQHFLVAGTIDAVIHLDLDVAAERAVAAMVEQIAGRAPILERLPVSVVLKENAPTLPAAYAALDRHNGSDASRMPASAAA